MDTNCRFSIWTQNANSRPSLILSSDGGKTYTKVAVFSNEESVAVFQKWIQQLLMEVFHETN